jgi:hypothetical protein
MRTWSSRHVLSAIRVSPRSPGAETAQLDVFVQEAEPLDWLLIRNVEGCGPVIGGERLTVDFRGSVGQVVIDTGLRRARHAAIRPVSAT